jgi:H+/gluconate symporter-like permease
VPKPRPTSAQSPVRSAQGKTTRRFRLPRWLGIGVALVGVATASATGGAFLAVSLNSTPLLQSELSQEDAAVFNQNDPITGGGTCACPD